jgi:hypothetical protein
MRLAARLAFYNVNWFRDTLLEELERNLSTQTATRLHTIIVDSAGISCMTPSVVSSCLAHLPRLADIDSTAMRVLEDLHQSFRLRGVRLLFCDVKVCETILLWNLLPRCCSLAHLLP